MKKFLIAIILIFLMLPTGGALANSADNHNALSDLDIMNKNIDITKIVVSYTLNKNEKKIEEEYILKSTSNNTINTYGYITKDNAEVYLNKEKLETVQAFVLHQDGLLNKVSNGKDVTEYVAKPFDDSDVFKEYTFDIEKDKSYPFSPNKYFSIENRNINFFDFGEESFIRTGRDIKDVVIVTSDETSMSGFNCKIRDIPDIYQYYNQKITASYDHYPEGYVDAYINSFWYLTEISLINGGLQFNSQIVGFFLREYSRFEINIKPFTMFNITIYEKESLEKYKELKENFNFPNISLWYQPLVEVTLNLEDGYYTAVEFPAQFYKDGKNQYILSTSYLLPFALNFEKAPSIISVFLNKPEGIAITVLSSIIAIIIIYKLTKIIRAAIFQRRIKKGL